jgi:serine phosphatase RsbU (regulator of sigma subunit)
MPGFETAADTIPNAQVGGDLYDCIRLNDHEFALTIADATGKGGSGGEPFNIEVLKISATDRIVTPGRRE